MLIMGAVVFLAIFAPWVVPHDPEAQSLPDRRMPPFWVESGSFRHVLGTDSLGRDILSRMFYGARITALVAAGALMLGGGIGLTLGILAGYLGGKVDALVMRAVDATMSFPTILFALVMAVALGPGLLTIIVALVVIVWASYARIMRADVLSVRHRDHVIAATAIGCSHFRIMVVHILPMVLNTFLVVLSLNAGQLILTEATLSFLGAGVPPDTPTWGAMVADGRRYVATAWWISVVPGIAITLVVLALNLFGDWLRDRLDPRLRGR